MASRGLDITEYRQRVKSFLDALPVNMLRVNQSLALSAVPMITGRIINKGIDATGKRLGSYSTNPLPLFFFNNRGTGSGADNKLNNLVKRKRKDALKSGEKFKGVSYKEYRELNNRPTDFVTLSFTGETLGDIGVVDERVDNNIVRTTVGARNTKSKAKYNAKGQKVGENKSEQILDYLGERYGENILAVNPEEEQLLADVFDAELQKLIDEHLS